MACVIEVHILMLLQNSVLLANTVDIGSMHEGKKGNACAVTAVKTTKEKII